VPLFMKKLLLIICVLLAACGAYGLFSKNWTDDVIPVGNNDFFPVVTEYLADGHEVIIPTKGNSMKPNILDGDVVLLKAAKKYKVGDAVLAFTTRDYWVLHRIMAIDGDSVTLKGDNNKGCEKCLLSKIVGKYIKKVEGGKASSKVTQNKGKIMNDKKYCLTEGIALKQIGETFVLIDERGDVIDFSKLITLNETAAELWKMAEHDKTFSINTMAKKMCEMYDAEISMVEKDCEGVLREWISQGFVKEK